jgi:hypothetical protein
MKLIYDEQTNGGRLFLPWPRMMRILIEGRADLRFTTMDARDMAANCISFVVSLRVWYKVCRTQQSNIVIVASDYRQIAAYVVRARLIPAYWQSRIG